MRRRCANAPQACQCVEGGLSDRIVLRSPPVARPLEVCAASASRCARETRSEESRTGVMACPRGKASMVLSTGISNARSGVQLRQALAVPHTQFQACQIAGLLPQRLRACLHKGRSLPLSQRRAVHKRNQRLPLPAAHQRAPSGREERPARSGLLCALPCSFPSLLPGVAPLSLARYLSAAFLSLYLECSPRRLTKGKGGRTRRARVRTPAVPFWYPPIITSNYYNHR